MGDADARRMHPDVAALLADLAAAQVPALSAGTPADARALLSRLRPQRSDAPAMHRVAEAHVDVPGARLAVRVYEPEEDPPASILYFHGGGWVVGSIATSDFLLRHFAAATGLRVVAGSYRLAPEHQFPTAVDDAFAVLQWAQSLAAGLAPDKRALFVAGDSAGGNLATVTALRAASAGGVPITGQILFYPVVDHDQSRPSYAAARGIAPLSAEDMAWFWDHYAPRLSDRRSSLASPLLDANLAVSPPAFVAVADHDPLRDEGLAYGDALRRAGVPVTLKLYPGTVHGFLSSPDRLAPAREALTNIADFIARLLARPGT